MIMGYWVEYGSRIKLGSQKIYTGPAHRRTGQKYEWLVQFYLFVFVGLIQSGPSKIFWPVHLWKNVVWPVLICPPVKHIFLKILCDLKFQIRFLIFFEVIRNFYNLLQSALGILLSRGYTDLRMVSSRMALIRATFGPTFSINLRVLCFFSRIRHLSRALLTAPRLLRDSQLKIL